MGCVYVCVCLCLCLCVQRLWLCGRVVGRRDRRAYSSAPILLNWTSFSRLLFQGCKNNRRWNRTSLKSQETFSVSGHFFLLRQFVYRRVSDACTERTLCGASLHERHASAW